MINKQSLDRLDNRPINLDSDEILCFSCVRNESLRLPYFLKYHRALGVDRFLFVDNGSNDGTVDFLLSLNDAHVFYTQESYAASKCGVVWLNELLNRFGKGHWTLTLDPDELLVYPYCEKVGLRHLTSFLNQTHAQGLETFLLDMYSDKAIKDTLYKRGEPFGMHCEFFDRHGYHERDPNGIPIRGGPRHRLFWEGRERKKPSPVLKKVPLVKWREGLEFEASTHVIRNLHLASITGVLQHYKLFSDFYTYTKQETARKEHWDAAAQYESYWRVLRDTPNLNAMHEGSIKYRDSAQLVELGLIKSPEEFEQFAKQLTTS